MDIQKIAKNFASRGFLFNYFETVEEANEYIASLIPENATVGFGGSVTVKEMNLTDAVKGRTLLHRDLVKDVEPAILMDKMHYADWYVSSANALCVTGDIVNIDGRGNRVGEIVNGPKNILIVCGVNKITEDIASGIERTRNVASPPNCVRLNKKTPCAVTGKCSYCNSPDTICRATVILHHPTTGKQVHIVLVNKKLGY